MGRRYGEHENMLTFAKSIGVGIVLKLERFDNVGRERD
jgi:hypothetical protein